MLDLATYTPSRYISKRYISNMKGKWHWLWILALWALPVGAQTINDPNLQLERFALDLDMPITMAFIGEQDILVLEKNTGRVRRVLNDVLLSEPVLDVDVHFLLERGLLGIATDPDFINNQYVYLYFTESSTGSDTEDINDDPAGNRLYRTTWNGSALVDPVLVKDLPVAL